MKYVLVFLLLIIAPLVISAANYRSELAATMSRYLVDRINGLANVEVVTGATISRLEGRDGMLEAVHWRIGADGQEVRRRIIICSCSLAQNQIPTG